ncbi:hypothetical protein HDU87_004784 [Geranomyces variabilis]|uniref:Rgp1-domain-containing protein n=1 Tax=Geranomyces variabilis TaxID=109894 RepID=A0AAD5THT1_9FUNG|nr:hypothetical protein HDU87_004784 [Geranomyces variabilis]
MVVVLTVKLGNRPRGSDNVFFAGEKFTCHLTFLNSVPLASEGSGRGIPQRPAPIAPLSKPPFTNRRRSSFPVPPAAPPPALGQSQLATAAPFVPPPVLPAKTRSELELEESFGALEDAPLARNVNAPNNGATPGSKQSSLENLSLSQLLRKSLSLSSLRSAVGSTIDAIGTSPESQREALLSRQQPRAEGQKQNTAAAASASAIVASGQPIPQNSSPEPTVPSDKPVGEPSSKRISLHAVPDQQTPLPLPLRRPPPEFSSQDSLNIAPTTPNLIRSRPAHPPNPHRRAFHDPGHSNQRGSAPSAHGTVSRHEEIAWGYAQMTGEFSGDPAFLKTSVLAPLRSIVMYRPAGAVGGGGTLGVTSGTKNVAVERAAVSELKSMPVYGTPPSILFTNMALAPGESKTYQYEISLPETLPPTHKGKVIRFSYKLIVGIQRGGTTQKSQVFQLPFRVFSFVQDDGSRPVYEILSPAVFTKDEAHIVEETGYSALHAGIFHEAFAPVAPVSKSRRPDDLSVSLYDREEVVDCLARAIARCQMSRKANYDICKNADHVAQLILHRTTYKLGDTVMGILDFTNSVIPCFRISAYLESQETITEAHAVRPAEETSALARKTYAEQHRCTLGTRRTGIELFVPPGASPDFTTTAVSVRWHLRVEFVTGTERALHQRSATNATFVHRHARNASPVEAFDCVIPLQVYGCGDGRVGQTQSYEIA